MLSGAEPRHLATLVAVAETLSFKAAGERLGYAPSNVSQHIAQLESVLATGLVTRTSGHHTVTLTDVGAIVARHAEGVLTQLDAAAHDLRALQHRAPRLRVGVHDRVMIRAITRAIELLSATDPDLRVLVRDSHAPPVERASALRRGLLDVAFDDLPLPSGPFDHVAVLRDPIVLVVHRDSPLTANGRLDSLEALADLALLADRDSALTGVLESQLQAAGVQPQFVMRSGLASDSLQALVAADLGAALLPRLAVDLRDEATAAMDLGNLLPPRRIALYWHRQRRRIPGLDAFRTALQQALDEACPSEVRS